MNYIELQIIVEQPFTEILIAELGLLDYESFSENEDGLNAYIQETLFDTDALTALQTQYQETFTFQYQSNWIEAQNWNALWESNYEPVLIANRCLIKSSFHQIPNTYPYEILINPKMSFGTGHHETTALMIEHQLNIPHQHKKVMDAGCGTGILAIMAVKLGASEVIAFDVEEWAVENAKENVVLNECPQIEVSQNTIQTIGLKEKYAIILANINKNVLIEEIPRYVQFLESTGFLLLSGFYEEDEQDIINLAQQNLLNLEAKLSKNRWSSLVFRFKNDTNVSKP